MARIESKDPSTALEQELAHLIRESAPDIVKRVIDKAREGSYQHAKFLFELAGIDLVRPADEEESPGGSLVEFLRQELKAVPPEAALPR